MKIDELLQAKNTGQSLETVLEIEGGHALNGDIAITGAKNALLPLLTATLLTDETVYFDNVPCLSDMLSMRDLLAVLGAEIISQDDRHIALQTKKIESFEAPYHLVSKMRASILVMGALLGRFGVAKVSLPGGCNLGVRAIDLHLKAFEAMGANIVTESGFISARAPKGLVGAEIEFYFPSVGATENAMAAAVLAKGITTINNAAKEPEIVDFADCLNKMGAKISGAGSKTITIEGVSKLHGMRHQVIADRLEAASYALAGAVCGGEITLRHIHRDIFHDLHESFDAAGIDVVFFDDDVGVHATVKQSPNGLKPTNITTAPFPGFPTDIQAQWMAMSLFADGDSKITETIFENRYMHVNELCRMGAEIKIDDRKSYITGNSHLIGCDVMASDIRASFALVIAGLRATKKTTIHRIYHLERGYEMLHEKLAQCGAHIKREQQCFN